MTTKPFSENLFGHTPLEAHNHRAADVETLTDIRNELTFLQAVVNEYLGALTPAAAFPSAPSEGELFYETDTDKLWAYDGTVWVQQIASGAWDTWSPTVTNVTLGTTPTTTYRWTRMGRTIHYNIIIVLGSGGAFGTNPTITLPVISQQAGARFPIGFGWLSDDNAGSYLLIQRRDGIIFYINAAANPDSVTATVPFTSVQNDAISIQGTYEAAAST